MKRFGAIVWGAVLIASCNGQVDEGVGIGGETHFLVTCGAGCGPGLSCIDGACTRRCEPDFSSCSELARSATCVSAAEDAAGTTAFSGTCDVLCASDDDCAPLGTGYLCSAGACRAEPDARGAELGSAREPLVIAVDADTCESGLRWAGGDRGSEEMHPGSDCMGCHREKGTKPLMLGGTVYVSESQNPYNGGPDPLAGCFGLEGIQVTITDAAGKEYSTRTNRAGNFYFAGKESDLELPYSAKISFSRLEQQSIPFYPKPVDRVVDHEFQMLSTPSYGGCARCHSATAVVRLPTDEMDPEAVIPAGTVIFPPGLYPSN